MSRMRKLFRMQYEPCNGECYAPGDVLNLSGLSKDVPRRERLLADLKAIHDPICGNAAYRYGMDLDEESGTFVASFWHAGKLELFAGSGMVAVLEDFCQAVKFHFQTVEGIRELQDNPGLGAEVCRHSEGNKLDEFMREHGGIA